MKKQKIECQLLKAKVEDSNDLNCRLIFKIRGQKFAVDFSLIKIMGKVTTGQSGFVDKLEEFEDFKKYYGVKE